MKKLLLLLLIPICGYAAELQHGFNSPSFSGIGYSTHILTIKQLEDQGKQNNKNVADSLKAQAEREAAQAAPMRLNTPSSPPSSAPHDAQLTSKRKGKYARKPNSPYFTAVDPNAAPKKKSTAKAVPAASTSGQ